MGEIKKEMKESEISELQLERVAITLHWSMLTNSTCFPPNSVVLVNFDIPTSSRTSLNLAPPQTAERIIYSINDYRLTVDTFNVIFSDLNFFPVLSRNMWTNKQ